MKCNHFECKEKGEILINNEWFCKKCAIYTLIHGISGKKRHYNCIKRKWGCYCKCQITKKAKQENIELK